MRSEKGCSDRVTTSMNLGEHEAVGDEGGRIWRESERKKGQQDPNIYTLINNFIIYMGRKYKKTIKGRSEACKVLFIVAERV